MGATLTGTDGETAENTMWKMGLKVLLLTQVKTFLNPNPYLSLMVLLASENDNFIGNLTWVWLYRQVIILGKRTDIFGINTNFIF